MPNWPEEMAAKEKNETRKAELIAIAETCERVPEHPARNLREAIQSHFFCHILQRSSRWAADTRKPIWARTWSRSISATRRLA